MRLLIAAALSVCLAVLVWTPARAGGETPSNQEAKVHFANIQNGETVSSPVTLIFWPVGDGGGPIGG